MHRALLPDATSRDIDHVNGNGLDNRRANLRAASRSENIANSGPRMGRRFKGAYPVGNVWTSKICVRGTKTYLGCFATEEEAAHTYDKAALAAWGAFAYLNFPD